MPEVLNLISFFSFLFGEVLNFKCVSLGSEPWGLLLDFQLGNFFVE